MSRRWSGCGRQTGPMPRSPSFALLARLARPHRRSLIGFGVALAASSLGAMIGPFLLGVFVDRAASGTANRLLWPAIGYVGIALIAAVVQIVVTYQSTALAWRITNELRVELAERVLSADRSFLRDTTPGELVSRIDGDVTALAGFLSSFVSRLLAAAMLALGGTLLLALRLPWLAPIFFLQSVMFAALLWRRRAAGLVQSMNERAAEAEVLGVIEERLSGADDIATLGAGSHAVARVAAASDVLVTATGLRARAQMSVVAQGKSVLMAGEVAMIIGGGALAARGLITIGSVFVGYELAGALRAPIEGIIWRLQEIQGAGGSAQRIVELLSATEPRHRGDRHLPAGSLDVCFDNVTLVYDDGENAVLDGISLRVAPGHRLGVVGRTGSGKTSIARLALRLVDATTGAVRMGGVDVNDIDEREFRRRVGAVPQEVQLFPGTVRDNVALFDETLDDERVIAALASVGLSGWLAGLPAGLDTNLSGGEAGAGLSAGEAQLLALARLFTRSHDIVILDEATSRIDPVTQQRLAEATEQLLQGRTSIVIAHRLATLERCDDIAVVDGGVIVEFGARHDLVADRQSRFSELVALGGTEELV